MKISLDRTSSMFGLTFDNLQIPEMQKFLRKKGMIVTFPDSSHATIESNSGGFFDRSFSERVKEIEASAANKAHHGLNIKSSSVFKQCSWSILSGFVIVLGSAAIATALAILAGASVPVVAGIAICSGATALVAYGLFHACYRSESNASVERQQPLSTI